MKSNIRSKKVTMLLLLLISVLLVIFFVNLHGFVAHAAGVIPEDIVSGSSYLYQKYGLDHYTLDYQYVSQSLNGIVDELVFYVFYFLVSLLWYLSTMVSKFGMFLLGQAYEFDLIDGAVDTLSGSLQKLLGINSRGFASTGLLPTFLILTLLFLGGYVVCMGLYKRQNTKAYSAVVNYLLVLFLSVAFALNAGTYVKTINELSNEVSQSILSIGTTLITGNRSGNGTAVDEIKETLFTLQIREPWLYLEFGDTEESAIGRNRVRAIEKEEKNSEDRVEAVSDEIEDNDNNMLTQKELLTRLGSTFLFLILNVVITLFVGFFAVLLILSQILLLVFVLILPLTFVIGLIPGKHMVAYGGLMNAFQYMVIKIGISFLLMLTFSLSVFLSELSSGSALLFRMFLQLVCYVGIYKSLGKIVDLTGMKSVRNVAEKKQQIKEFKRDHIDAGAVKMGAKAARFGMAVATSGASEKSGAGKRMEENVRGAQRTYARRKSERERGRSDIYQSRGANTQNFHWKGAPQKDTLQFEKGRVREENLNESQKMQRKTSMDHAAKKTDEKTTFSENMQMKRAEQQNDNRTEELRKSRKGQVGSYQYVVDMQGKQLGQAQSSGQQKEKQRNRSKGFTTNMENNHIEEKRAARKEHRISYQKPQSTASDLHDNRSVTSIHQPENSRMEEKRVARKEHKTSYRAEKVQSASKASNRMEKRTEERKLVSRQGKSVGRGRKL